jgi:hypothetical protein
MHKLIIKTFAELDAIDAAAAVSRVKQQADLWTRFGISTEISLLVNIGIEMTRFKRG